MVIYGCLFATTPTNTHIYATTRSGEFWVGNLAFGLVEWFAFLLLEPFLVLAARWMRWLQSSPSSVQAE